MAPAYKAAAYKTMFIVSPTVAPTTAEKIGGAPLVGMLALLSVGGVAVGVGASFRMWRRNARNIRVGHSYASLVAGDDGGNLAEQI